MNAIVKRIFGGPVTEAASPINEQLQVEVQKAEELSRKINECETGTLQPLAQERAKRAELLDLKADAVVAGSSDTRKLDAEIAASTARLAELEAKAEYVNAAYSKLRRQLLEQQQVIRTLQEQLPRQHLQALDRRLTDTAEQYRTAIDQLNAALVEVAAIAAAYDSMVPRVAGSNSVASRGLASLDLPAPRHTAYKSIGGIQKLQQRVDARRVEILKELSAS